MSPSPDGDEGLSPSAQANRKSQPYLDAVWRFTGGTLVGTGMGWGLDRFRHSLPLWTLIGFFVGTSVGFYAMYRTIARLDRRK